MYFIYTWWLFSNSSPPTHWQCTKLYPLLLYFRDMCQNNIKDAKLSQNIHACHFDIFWSYFNSFAVICEWPGVVFVENMTVSLKNKKIPSKILNLTVSKLFQICDQKLKIVGVVNTFIVVRHSSYLAWKK